MLSSVTFGHVCLSCACARLELLLSCLLVLLMLLQVKQLVLCALPFAGCCGKTYGLFAYARGPVLDGMLVSAVAIVLSLCIYCSLLACDI
jgi:hypothetical protein